MSTTAKRKKPRKDDPLRRPFDRGVMARAKAIAARYQITLWRENGRWFAVGVEEPGAYGDGRTIPGCVRDVREALAVAVACHLERGEAIVRPLTDRERSRRRAG